MKLSREQTITLSWSTLAAIASSVMGLWAFAGPIAGQALKDQIKQEIEPLMTAQIITISTTVRNLRNAIAALEFKREMCAGASCWTIRDAEDLAAARADLAAAEAALRALRQ